MVSLPKPLCEEKDPMKESPNQIVKDFQGRRAELRLVLPKAAPEIRVWAQFSCICVVTLEAGVGEKRELTEKKDGVVGWLPPRATGTQCQWGS